MPPASPSAGAALLILGASGRGKSALALGLMAAGATLVADDRTHLHARRRRQLVASAPAAIAGLIEARGIGILKAEALGGGAAWRGGRPRQRGNERPAAGAALDQPAGVRLPAASRAGEPSFAGGDCAISQGRAAVMNTPGDGRATIGEDAAEGAAEHRLVLVTGPSGAGRSTAIQLLRGSRLRGDRQSAAVAGAAAAGRAAAAAADRAGHRRAQPRLQRGRADGADRPADPDRRRSRSRCSISTARRRS